MVVIIEGRQRDVSLESLLFCSGICVAPANCRSSQQSLSSFQSSQSRSFNCRTSLPCGGGSSASIPFLYLPTWPIVLLASHPGINQALSTCQEKAPQLLSLLYDSFFCCLYRFPYRWCTVAYLRITLTHSVTSSVHFSVSSAQAQMRNAGARSNFRTERWPWRRNR